MVFDEMSEEDKLYEANLKRMQEEDARREKQIQKDWNKTETQFMGWTINLAFYVGILYFCFFIIYWLGILVLFLTVSIILSSPIIRLIGFSNFIDFLLLLILVGFFTVLTSPEILNYNIKIWTPSLNNSWELIKNIGFENSIVIVLLSFLILKFFGKYIINLILSINIFFINFAFKLKK